MQKQKCSLDLYSDFLIASQTRYSGVELAHVDPTESMAHDAVSRWLSSSRFQPTELLNQVKHLTDPAVGYLLLDDSTLDKRYSRTNELAKKQYSGNEHGLINGINLVNLLWTNMEKFVPIDYRIYRKGTADHQNKTKHNHFREMLKRAVTKGFSKNLKVLFDTWYASIENLKFIRSLHMQFICSIASNRQVSVTKGTYVPVQDLDFTKEPVHKVWLKEFGFVLVAQTVTAGGDVTYLMTNGVRLTNYDTLVEEFRQRWHIEEFHRGIKQTTGIERCYSIKARSQKTHIFAAFRAFLKLEAKRIDEGISRYEQKAEIPRMATANYLAFCANA
jgi:hypothetical protein